ncbi:peptide chain release factor N(5)-glutamine methyltransferase [Spiribacter roseus]|uniref:Release factor glutamine methyltransferase n=2 Tax=Spiribacter roseus TaxID=1855875 RepID=A0ABV3RV08_9GAMM|nr:peptide chain release factor N(5)-glutamine methyltransferase [Spiribacter roseus]
MTGAVTLAEARQRGQRMLDPVSVSAAVDADWLLGAATGQSAAQRRAHPEQPLAEPAWRRYQGLLQRRYRGEPVAYLLGRCGFMDFELVVTPAVLIPRPETEHLVEAALESPAARVLELGTGSGCIAIALGRAWPNARIDATDQSAEALTVANQNAALLGVDNLRLRQGDWYEPVGTARYDLIVSNPPYIGPAEPEPDQGDARFEPRAALRADESGLAALRIIIEGAAAHLEDAGRLWVEHGHTQGPAVREYLAAQGFEAIETRRDLAGHERISGGRRGAQRHE